MTEDLLTVVRQATQVLLSKGEEPPKAGLILGSGLGFLADELAGARRVPAADIEGYPPSTVEGHSGTFHVGKLEGVPTVVLAGRIHAYEGHAPPVLGLPARILCALGIRVLVVTNAAGGVNRDYRPGDLMVLTDHLNLTGTSPLTGPSHPEFGPRFPDMSAVYPVWLRQRLRPRAEALGLSPHEGVYAWLPGPQYETPAEVRMLRILGADAVGMSTVPEAIVAAHMGVPVLGISLITNQAAGLSGSRLSHQEVLETAQASGVRLGRLIRSVLPDLVTD